MSDRPILFSAPMVRAILAGTKTQTRRAWKVQPPAGVNIGWVPGQSTTPYGKAGDRLWVRESWSPDPPCDGTWGYTAWAGCRDGHIAGVPERFRHPAFCNYAANWLHGPIRWTPSIHMPRWASRITLNITGVSVERLQDISEADAMAEGVQAKHTSDADYSARDAFRVLWESINGSGSWDANPWVWIVEFERAAAAALTSEDPQ